MSGCKLTAGWSKRCKDNMGGIKEVYITNHENVDWTNTIPLPGSASPEDEGVITTIAMNGSPEEKFYKFVPNKDSSNWVENIQSNVQNGTVAYEQVLNVIFAKNEATKRNQVKLLAQAELAIIVKDKNNKYWMLGEENGVELTGGNGGSGTAMTDLNGWTLTFTGTERFPAREVDEDIIVDILYTE